MPAPMILTGMAASMRRTRESDVGGPMPPEDDDHQAAWLWVITGALALIGGIVAILAL